MNDAPRTIAVFLMPAEADRRQLEVLVHRLAACHGGPVFMPHLTLRSGTTDDLAALTAAVDRLATETPPLTVPVAGIDHGDRYFRALYLSFPTVPRLDQMHRQLARHIRRRDDGAFAPHVSLLYHDPSTAQQAMADCRRDWPSGAVRFDAVAVVSPGDDHAGWHDTDSWEVLHRAPLIGINRIRAVLFDYGGVLAEEGFRDGLRSLAVRQGLDPDQVHRAGMEEVYGTGYVLGTGSEAEFWQAMRRRTGLAGTDDQLTTEVLDRFVLRPGMIASVRRLRERGYRVAILSDQTDWLERLDRRDGFYDVFLRVFNSYRLGIGKADPAVFDLALRELGVAAEEALFIDDLPGNILRASSRGMHTILFRDEQSFRAELDSLLGSG